jgi:spoIIIJ-associated protein
VSQEQPSTDAAQGDPVLPEAEQPADLDVDLDVELDDSELGDGALDDSEVEDIALDDTEADDEVDAEVEDEDEVEAVGSAGFAKLLEREGDVAADYLEGLLDIADVDGDIDMDVEGERALVSIVGGDLGALVGRDGAVLEALQELTRLAVLRETGNRSRLMLDIDGHRARRRSELTERGRAAAEEARRTGAPVRLTPMSAFERKVVHDAVAAAGLTSESEGEEPNRFVVVIPG